MSNRHQNHYFGKTNVYHYWQLLIILFADDRTKKIMELHLFVNRERENLFLARQILARQRGAVMAFIPDPSSWADLGYICIWPRVFFLFFFFIFF